MKERETDDDQETKSSLPNLAQRLESTARWEDLTLPERGREALCQISAHIQQKASVKDVRRDTTNSIGRVGVTVLFVGPNSGAKAVASSVLANRLDLKLYRIDLSRVVSKYIGETEKNLRRIFDEAERDNAILFFDEADALFGRRSEIKDAHDRFAKIEIGYLRGLIEHYRGVAILATNTESNIDQKFLRRLRFVVEFPLPDEGQRKSDWGTVFGREKNGKPSAEG